jgi:hypothetical protein
MLLRSKIRGDVRLAYRGTPLNVTYNYKLAKSVDDSMSRGQMSMGEFRDSSFEDARILN